GEPSSHQHGRQYCHTQAAQKFLRHRSPRHRSVTPMAATIKLLSPTDKTRMVSRFYSNALTRNGGGNVCTNFAGFLVWNTFYFGSVIAFVRLSGLAGNSIVLQHRCRSTTVL